MKVTGSILVLLCIAILLLAGCANMSAPEVVAVAADAPKLAIPPECNDRKDHQWSDFPDRDVRRSEAAQNYAGNRRSYRALRSKRRICFAGLRALQR